MAALRTIGNNVGRLRRLDIHFYVVRPLLEIATEESCGPACVLRLEAQCKVITSARKPAQVVRYLLRRAQWSPTLIEKPKSPQCRKQGRVVLKFFAQRAGSRIKPRVLCDLYWVFAFPQTRLFKLFNSAGADSLLPNCWTRTASAARNFGSCLI